MAKEKIGGINIHVDGVTIEGDMLTQDELSEILSVLDITEIKTVKDLMNRFQPKQFFGDKYYINDTIMVPRKIIPDKHYDYDTCSEICDYMNELHMSYINAIVDAYKHERAWENKYHEIWHRNRKLESDAMNKILDTISVEGLYDNR